MRHRPELDGLRGLAVALVVAYHADVLAGGWIGVGLFFALSGFLITTLLVSELDTTGDLDLPTFYRRRLARLAPALVVALAVSVAWHHNLAGCLLVLAYVANVASVFTRAVVPSWSWSLALEEQFYLLWPSTLRRVLPRFGRNRVAGG